eukprot:m.157794 g.157794  ORF g.157794 m.157794 type:complete len:633 (-) comp17590_c0_seq12:28-1926(-)
MSHLLAVLLATKDNVTPARLLFWYPRELACSDTGSKPAPPGTTVPALYSIQSRQDLDHVFMKPTNTKDPAFTTPADRFAQPIGPSGTCLADALIPTSSLLNQKFELVIDDFVFVGHPSLVAPKGDDKHCEFVYNVVFLLSAGVSRDAVSAYHALAARLSSSLRHQEERKGHLSQEIRIMIEAHEQTDKTASEESPEYVISMILAQSQLARNLRDVYGSIHDNGRVNVKIDGWVSVSMCAPVSELPPAATFPAPPSVTLDQLRPFHTILLRTSVAALSPQLLDDASPVLRRLLDSLSPLKSFEELSAELDVPLSLVLRMAVHLVSWNEAKIIYPLCATNRYLLSSSLDLGSLSVQTMDSFASAFPDHSLAATLEDYSHLRQLSEHMNALAPEEDTERLQIVAWLLQRDLVVILRTFVFLVPFVAVQDPCFTSADDEDALGCAPLTDDLDEPVTPGSLLDEALEEPREHRRLSPLVPRGARRVSALSGAGMPSLSGLKMTSASAPTTAVASPTSATGSPGWDSGPDASSEGTGFESEQVLPPLFSIPPHDGVSLDDLQAINAAFEERRETVTFEEYKLCLRLCPFFHGQNSLEDIMWRENISRSRLNRVLEAFDRVLVCAVFPEDGQTHGTSKP